MTNKTGTLTKNEMNVFRVLITKVQIELKETVEDTETKALDKKKNVKKF